MNGTWRLVTAPAAEPVALDDAKAHLRVDGDADNARIQLLLTATRKAVEEELSRALVTQTWALDLEEFPCGAIRLPRAPVQGVSHVKYYDPADVQQTWPDDEYETEFEDLPPRLEPRDGYSYPSTKCRTRAVTVTFVAGYGDAATVPENIRAAILLRLELLYRGGEGADALRTAAAALLSPFKVWM